MLIAEAIGMGLVVSLFFTEVVGFAAGGFVVPGYVALYLDKPFMLAGTVMAAGATYLAAKLAGRYLIIYGRRSLVFAVLVGFIFGVLVSWLPSLGVALPDGGLAAIGYIIPGLIAYWMIRQGIVRTLASLLVAAVLVRLALIVLHGGSLPETPVL